MATASVKSATVLPTLSCSIPCSPIDSLCEHCNQHILHHFLGNLLGTDAVVTVLHRVPQLCYLICAGRRVGRPKLITILAPPARSYALHVHLRPGWAHG